MTATEAARRFSDLLNRVRYRGETVTIVRGGEEVGRLVPMPDSRPATLRSFVETVLGMGRPDPAFAHDLEAVHARLPLLDRDPWDS